MASSSEVQVQMAAERTLLAWVRTGIAIMAFGFVVARYEAPKPDAALIGATLILLGAVANALASREYARVLRARAPASDPNATPIALPRPYSVPLAQIIAALGILLAGWLLLRTAFEVGPTSRPAPGRSVAGSGA